MSVFNKWHKGFHDMASHLQKSAALLSAFALAGCATSQSMVTPNVGRGQAGLQDPCVKAGVVVSPTSMYAQGQGIVRSEVDRTRAYVLTERHDSTHAAGVAGAGAGAVGGGLLGRVLGGAGRSTVTGAIIGAVVGAAVARNEAGTAEVANIQNCVDTVRAGGYDKVLYNAPVSNMPRVFVNTPQ
jgi:uncharacterized protein YcfJ